uniref:Saposin B-type domain-containing protein n=1 Tax=Takifugu rubripes TaxID=31033 RepID=A0A3B5KEF2_TAKRU
MILKLPLRFLLKSHASTFDLGGESSLLPLGEILTARGDCWQVLRDEAFPGSCRVCKMIVSKVIKSLGSDHSRVMNIIHFNTFSVCKKTGPLRSLCNKVLSRFKDKLMSALEQGGRPQQICVRLKLCRRKRTIYK